MSEDELKPDWDMSLYEEVITEQCKLIVAGMEYHGWIRSHIFEYTIGELGVWMIARPKKSEMSRTPEWIHCYVRTDGSTVRYKPPSAIILNVEDDE